MPIAASLERINAVASRGEEHVKYVRSLMAVVAFAGEHFRPATQMSKEEQMIWESVGADFSDDDAFDRNGQRWMEALSKVLQSSIRGDAALAEILSVDRSRVSQRVSDRSLFFLEIADERYYPTWQFDGNKTVRGLKEVLAALALTDHPVTVDHWFQTPSVDLLIDNEPVSPLDWLRGGGDVQTAVNLLDVR